MRNNNFRKLITIALCFALVAVSTFVSGIISSANDSDNASKPEMKGDFLSQLDLSQHDAFSELVGYNLSENQNASVKGSGVDDSFALELKGESTGTAYMAIGEKAGVIPRKTDFTVTMKIKKSGTVNSFKFGAFTLNNVEKLQSENLSDSDIGTDWTTVTLNYDLTANSGKANIYLNWDVAEGSALYIDDVAVYLTSNIGGQNYFPEGSFDQTFYMDNTIEDEPIAGAFYNLNAPALTDNFKFVSGQGYKSSYGAKVSVADAESMAYIKLNAIGLLQNTTDYVIEFKAKKSEGISSLSVLLNEYNSDSTAFILSDDSVDKYVSDEFAVYRVNYTTGTNASKGQSMLKFVVTGEKNSYIVVDDVAIYKASDATKANVITNSSFDRYRILEDEDMNMAAAELEHFPLGEYAYVSDRNSVKSIPNNANASIVKEGVDDSWALKLSGNAAENEAFMTVGTGAGYFFANSKIKVSLQVKADCNGAVFAVGSKFQWDDVEYHTVDLTNDWQTVNFDYTVPETSNGWHHIALKWNIPTDGAVYVDNIVVTEDTDPNSFNRYPEGGFDLIAFETAAADETPEQEAGYTPLGFASVAELTQVEGAGVKNSYGLVANGTGSAVTSTIRCEGRPGLDDYTEYYIEFALKKTGTFTNIDIGIKEQWVNHTIFSLNSKELIEKYNEDGFYNYYRVKYATNGACSGSDGTGAWTYFTVNSTGDSGAKLYIDDIKIYAVQDETKYNKFIYGACDVSYTETEFDNTPDFEYVPRDITYYTSKHNFNMTGTKDEIVETLSVVEKAGVKGSSALKIKGTGKELAFKFTVENTNELLVLTDFVLGLKVRYEVEEGAAITDDTSFKFGLTEKWGGHWRLSFKGDDFGKKISTEYKALNATHKTSKFNNGEDSWSYLIFSSKLPEGVNIYIDDIYIKPANPEDAWTLDTDGNPLNLYSAGTFDTPVTTKQTGLNQIETVPEDTAPYLSYNYSTLSPAVIAVSDAPKDNYVLRLGSAVEDVNNKDHIMLISPSQASQVFKISFWIKVVGDAECRPYAGSGNWRKHATGLYFNQYNAGEWTYCEFTFQDLLDAYQTKTYRRWIYSITATAGSYVLIDDLQVYRTDCDYVIDIFGGGIGNFETQNSYPEIAWDKNDRFIYKEGK